MEILLVLINLSGIFLYVESACDTRECDVPASGAQTCSGYEEYKECLEDEKKGCTDGQTAMRYTIDTIIERAEGIRESLDCNRSGCDAASCKPTSVTSCSAYETYLDCLEDEKKKCTDKDTVNSGLISTAMTAAEAAQIALRCNGMVLKLSVSTLILSLFAFYLKP